MRRGAAIALVTVVAVGCCVLAVDLLSGGGTVRSPRHGSGTTAGHEVADDVNAKPGGDGGPGTDGRGKDGSSSNNGGTSASGPGISFAAVGDTMLGTRPNSHPTPAPTSTP
jgi:hypothetical protein